MKDIAIYGMGGFGREVACLVKYINETEPTWNLIGFFDDGKCIGESCEYGIVLGGIKELNDWPKPLNVSISIGKPTTLKNLVVSIINPLIEFPNIIAPDTCWYDRSTVYLGKGNIISRECQYSCNVKIGDFNIFNYRVGVGHDTTLGNYNSLMTGTKIAGNVIMGNMNYCGTNSVIIQGMMIGNNTTIAAGSVVMRRTKEGFTYIGIPANAWIMTKKKSD